MAEPQGVRSASCSAFEFAQGAPTPDPLAIAFHAQHMAAARVQHIAYGWKHPLFRDDTIADLPRLIAELESHMAALIAAARDYSEARS